MSKPNVKADLQQLVQDYHEYIKAQAANDDKRAQELVDQAAKISIDDPEAFSQFMQQAA